MLKTNSKKAVENIRRYIMENYDPCGYDNAPENTESFQTVAAFILATFEAEKPYTNAYCYKYRISRQDLFAAWASGLPSIIDTCYYYNRSAVNDLGGILEETEAEKEKYTEEEAERMLSYLIYRELTKAA